LVDPNSDIARFYAIGGGSSGPTDTVEQANIIYNVAGTLRPTQQPSGQPSGELSGQPTVIPTKIPTSLGVISHSGPKKKKLDRICVRNCHKLSALTD